MQSTSMHSACPVGVSGLVLLELSHWGYDDRVHTGQLIVGRPHSGDLTQVFRVLFEARFPIERMEPVYHYQGSDRLSMEANNTSAFNCRRVAGTERWSEHSYGRAIDINPKTNPWVRPRPNGTLRVDPPSGAPNVDRTLQATGMIHPQGTVVQAFAAIGWDWGGFFRNSKDYHHFSATGR